MMSEDKKYTPLNSHPVALRQPMVELIIKGVDGDKNKEITPRVLTVEVQTSVVGPGNRAKVKVLRPEETIDIGAEAVLFLGYLKFKKWMVFKGFVTDTDHNIQMTIEMQDSSWILENTKVGGTHRTEQGGKKQAARLAKSAKEVVEYTLKQAGIAEKDLDLGDRIIDPYTMKEDSALNHLQNAAKSFEIRYPCYFDLNQKFHWHPLRFPVTPIEAMRYGMDYRNFKSDNEEVPKESQAASGGSVWTSDAVWAPDAEIGPPITFDTFLRPWLKAGDAVTIEDERLSNEAAICVIEKVTHTFTADTTGTSPQLRRVFYI